MFDFDKNSFSGIKMDNNSKGLYHIYENGQRITDIDSPLTMEEIVRSYGPVRELERQGFKLVPVK